MDFSLSPEQEGLRDSVRKYLRDRYTLSDRKVNLSAATACSKKHWAAFADFGWLGAGLPEQAGGTGGSLIEISVILEEFGRALVLEPYLASAVLAARAISLTSGASSRHLLEPMIRGERHYALAHAEPGGHHYTHSIATEIDQKGAEDLLLNGRKVFVLNGDRADYFIVSARSSVHANQPEHVNLLLVDAHSPGISLRKFRTLDGSGVADVRFKDVSVPGSDVLSADGTALQIVDRSLDFTAIAMCAEAVGSMNRAIESTREYLKSRQTYGNTLSSYQALQHKFADMLVEYEMSRSILHRALAAFSTTSLRDQTCAASTAKAIVGRAGKLISRDAIQLHGAAGMVDDGVVGQIFKRLTVLAGLFGEPEFHLERRLDPLEQAN